jgi:hypothetical protein
MVGTSNSPLPLRPQPLLSIKPDGTVSTGFEETLCLLPKEGRIKRRVDGYILSGDWEMLPGEWSLSIVYPLFALVIINFDEHVRVRTRRLNNQPSSLTLSF